MNAASASLTWIDVSLRAGPVLLGAVIGGGISYLLARRSSQEVLRRDTESRTRETKQALAMAIVVYQRIVAELSMMRGYIEGQLALYDASDNPHKEPWWFVNTITGMDARDIPDFESSSLAAILLAGNMELMLELTKLQRCCLASHSSFADYSSRRHALAERMPTPKYEEGELVHQLSEEDRAQLLPFTDPLNSIIEGLVESLAKDWVLVKSTSGPFAELMRVQLDIPDFHVDIIEPPQLPQMQFLTLADLEAWGPGR